MTGRLATTRTIEDARNAQTGTTDSTAFDATTVTNSGWRIKDQLEGAPDRLETTCHSRTGAAPPQLVVF